MNYFLPIDFSNYDGPDIQYGNAPCTYVPHGPGRLDMGFNHEGDNIYSMTDGTVIDFGFYSNGIDSYCHIKTSNPILGTFYIRYLHGDYKGIVTKGQKVKKGDKIGTIGSHTTGNPHLHIDFQIDPMNADDTSFLGILDQNNRTFTFKGNTYKLSSNINIDKIRTWNTQRGDSADNTRIGYMWLIFAQKPKHLTPSVEPEGGILINRTAYDNTPGDGVTNVADFYFTGIVNEDFCGPPPAGTLTDIQNDPRYEGLRRMVNVCHHEFSGIGRFAFVAFAKLLRAQFCCNSGVYSNWGLNANNLNDMIINVSNSGSGDIGDISLNHDILPSDVTIEEIEAIYNNFRYPNIFGSNLHSAQDGEEYKQLILEGINSLPMVNGFIDNPTSPNYGYTQYHIEAPPYFLIAYNYNQKKTVPNGQLDYGCFIFYRYKNQVNSINPQVQ